MGWKYVLNAHSTRKTGKVRHDNKICISEPLGTSTTRNFHLWNYSPCNSRFQSNCLADFIEIIEIYLVKIWNYIARGYDPYETVQVELYEYTIISWSPMISSITSFKGLSALLGTRAANTGGSMPVYFHAKITVKIFHIVSKKPNSRKRISF